MKVRHAIDVVKFYVFVKKGVICSFLVACLFWFGYMGFDGEYQIFDSLFYPILACSFFVVGVLSVIYLVFGYNHYKKAKGWIKYYNAI